jgi:phosphate transport system permease protein
MPNNEAQSRKKLPRLCFSLSMGVSVFIVSSLILAMILSLVVFSLPAMKVAGLSIFTGTNWDPFAGQFGGLPFIVGTLITSVLALLISLPFSFAIAIFLGEFYKKGVFSTVIGAAIELLAGIPSIIYGTWGLYVLVPLIQKIELPLAAHGVLPLGVGVLTASLLLALMIIPYSASLAREVISLVPQDLKEAAYAMGGTRFSVVKRVTVPYAISGILAGELLAFGRALGETMAVAMVVGNMNLIPKSIFDPGSSIASLIANEYAESSGVHTAALTELGLILFVITIAFSFIGRMVINRMAVKG